LNAAFNKAGQQPIVAAQMKLDYTMTVDLRSRTEFLSYYTGDYDTPQIKTMLRLFQPNWQVLDVGANIGFYTIAMAQKLALLGGHVYSFEPVKSNFDRLCLNIEQNGVENEVTALAIALSNQQGAAEITLREDFQQGAATGNAAIVVDDKQTHSFETLPIKLDTLDHFCQSHNIDRVDFIKADIEGHEDLLFEGGLETIRKFQPIILAEMNEDYFGQRDIDLDKRIPPLLAGLDYMFLVCRKNGRWSHVSSLKGRGPADDVLLVPSHRLNSVLSLLHQQ